MIEKAQLIEDEKYYSVRQIFKAGLVPWIGSYDTLKRFVQKDLANDNKLRTIKSGNGRSTRYLIQGKAIKKLIEEAKQGIVFN